jgi:hypothetical protein
MIECYFLLLKIEFAPGMIPSGGKSMKIREGENKV